MITFKVNDKVYWYETSKQRGPILTIIEITENEIITNDKKKWFLNGLWKGNAGSVYWYIKLV